MISKLLLIVALVFSSIAYAFDYSAYKESTFENAMKQHVSAIPSENDVGISAALFKYKTKIRFTNKFREMPDSHKEFMKYWAKSLDKAEFSALYETEYLAQTDKFEIWVPVQTQVVPYMKEELKPNQEFFLYHVFAGVHKGDWFFLATEFDAE